MVYLTWDMNQNSDTVHVSSIIFGSPSQLALTGLRDVVVHTFDELETPAYENGSVFVNIMFVLVWLRASCNLTLQLESCSKKPSLNVDLSWRIPVKFVAKIA